MGADPHDSDTGQVPACPGNDIVDLLNEVFNNPHSDKYRTARENNQFGTVGTDVDLLIQAYQSALDVKVLNGKWVTYLKKLHGADPANISAIATFRYNHLTNCEGMITKIHEPVHGGHVKTLPGSGIDPAVVDSPYPLS